MKNEVVTKSWKVLIVITRELIHQQNLLDP